MHVILLSALSGVVGTGLGGLLTAILGSRTDKTISVFLSFAGGVMTSIVFFELIPEAVAHMNMAVTVAGLVIGVLLVLALNLILDRVSGADRLASALHESYKDFYHEDEIIKGETAAHEKNMIHSGMLMFFVIALHTIPEGMAIGVAGNHNATLGFTLALIIGIHNVPEGMAIAAPLISGGLSKVKATLVTLLAGTSTVVGALLGLLFGGLSDLATALAFSTAGGAMLYAVFGEILPQSMVMRKDRVPTIVLLVGVVFGMLLTNI
ncbi:MAG: ZIP family metal transporter [Clostridia bacterium]|nr:ZIP family metal transporter [Clostridia bacterium]